MKFLTNKQICIKKALTLTHVLKYEMQVEFFSECKAQSGKQAQYHHNLYSLCMLSVQCCQLCSCWVSWWTTACWGVCSREPPDHQTAVHPTGHQGTQNCKNRQHYSQIHSSSHCQCRSGKINIILIIPSCTCPYMVTRIAVKYRQSIKVNLVYVGTIASRVQLKSGAHVEMHQELLSDNQPLVHTPAGS